MKTAPLVMTLILAASLCAKTGSAMAEPTCDLASIKTAAKLHEALSARAVELVKRAAAAGWDSDGRLKELVSPDAPARLGSGDVGRPFGHGAAAIHAMALAMHADLYRYPGWDFMDGTAAPCVDQKVTVEFVDSSSQDVSTVDFAFRGGRLVSASGWEHSYSTGPLK